MENKMSLKSIAGGVTFKDVECILVDFKRNRDIYEVMLESEGCCREGYLKCNLYDYEQMKNFLKKQILISGLHEPGLSGVIKEKLKIKNIEWKQTDALEGAPRIEDERLDDYLRKIWKYKSYVGNENMSYRKLLDVFFSEENVKLMRTMPATHTRQGSPFGGMLHATAAVTEMAYYLAMRYVDCANNLYSFREKRTINWDLLITGGLLHLAGNLLYFEKEVPHEKRITGVEQGFSVCRHHVILKLILQHQIEMTDEELSALLGVMSKLNEQHEGIKKCRQEASFLYAAYCSFLEQDSFDSELTQTLKKNAQIGEGSIADTYGYSEILGCYISRNTIVRRADILGIELKKEEVACNAE